uniref:Putative secreted protein n=1 Tax=Anopheles triannulatus TaxID=58253 RepID=A0A2M4B3Y5_9DIPT
MSSCGAWIVTPAVVLSITCSYVPANRDTSVEVPPISNPISSLPSASRTPVTAYPTTPPAGPLRMARAPRNCSIRVRPPSLCMNSTSAPRSSSRKPARNPSRYRSTCGVR